MRVTALLATAIAFCLLAAGAAGAGAAERLSQREAALAVREEIGNRWLLLATVPRGAGAGAANVTVDCDWPSGAKRVCDWKARNDARGILAEGLAVVTDHRAGADARLYAYYCSARAEMPCF